MPSERLGPQSLGEALCLLRRRAGVTRSALAAAADMSTGALSTYENDGSVPSAQGLRRLTRALADCLRCDVTELWQELGDLLDQHGGARGQRADARRLMGRLSSTSTPEE